MERYIIFEFDIFKIEISFNYDRDTQESACTFHFYAH